MIKWLHKLNKAFDKMPTGLQLVNLIAIALPGIIAAETESLAPIWFFIGVGYLVALIVMRHFYLSGAMRRYIDKKASK